MAVQAADKGLFRPWTGDQGAAALCLARAQTLRSDPGQACPASSQTQGPTGHLPRAPLKPGGEGRSGKPPGPPHTKPGARLGCFCADCEEPPDLRGHIRHPGAFAANGAPSPSAA